MLNGLRKHSVQGTKHLLKISWQLIQTLHKTLQLLLSSHTAAEYGKCGESGRTCARLKRSFVLLVVFFSEHWRMITSTNLTLHCARRPKINLVRQSSYHTAATALSRRRKFQSRCNDHSLWRWGKIQIASTLINSWLGMLGSELCASDDDSRATKSVISQSCIQKETFSLRWDGWR